MKKIKLNTGNYVLVDDKDYNWLNQYNWTEYKSTYTSYAESTENGGTVLMHRMILGLQDGDGKHTHHINYNGLDNRLCNLRIVTRQQNMLSKRTTKGYYWNKQKKKWKAQIGFNHKTYYLGYFDDESDAHEAYLKAKQRYHKT
jgi:hypothetical protein